MPFADSTTPPPPWAVGSSRDPHEVLAEAEERAARPRRRANRPVPDDPEADPRRRGCEPDPHDWARQIVLRLLTNSPKSRQQLHDALMKRNCDPAVAAAVLDRMEQVGLVDDAAYAQMYVRSQQAGRGLASRALAQGLRRRGIDDETAREVLDDVAPADEEELARELVTKRMRRLHGLERDVKLRRLAGMLARKGYGSEVSMRVIREALADDPELQRD